MKKKRRRWQPRQSIPIRKGFRSSLMKLSLCMIVKNEAENLAPCIIPLLKVVDEVIVVDTGSTDGTQEIARELGAKVFDFSWCDDFSAARNESIRHATGDYILWLDADDRVDEMEIRKIAVLKKSFPLAKDEAYEAIVMSQSPLEGTTYFYQMRIFPRVRGALFEGKIHEQVVYSLQRLGVKRIPTEIHICHFGYGDVKTIQQKSERNLAILRKELEMNPENLLAHFYTGRTLAGMGRQLEAIWHMKRITSDERVRKEEKAFYLETSLLLGKYYTELKLYDEALNIFRRLSEEDPENGLVLFSLGEIFFQVRNYSGAIEALKRSLLYPIELGHLPINLEGISYHQHHTLAQCYLETGEEFLAIDVLERFLERYPDHSRTLKTLAFLSLRHQRFEAAVEFYERIIQRGEGSEEDYINVGLAYRKLGLWRDAEKALTKALEINPQRIEALTNLGYLYHEMEEESKALPFFMRALNIDPNLPDVRLTLSEIHFMRYDLDLLVEQTDALLRSLNLPRNICLESFKDLGDLYERIGESFSDRGRDPLSLMAYHISFLIHPSRVILDRILSMAKGPGVFELSVRKIEKALAFYKQQGKHLDSFEDIFTPLLH